MQRPTPPDVPKLFQAKASRAPQRPIILDASGVYFAVQVKKHFTSLPNFDDAEYQIINLCTDSDVKAIVQSLDASHLPDVKAVDAFAKEYKEIVDHCDGAISKLQKEINLSGENLNQCREAKMPALNEQKQALVALFARAEQEKKLPKSFLKKIQGFSSEPGRGIFLLKTLVGILKELEKLDSAGAGNFIDKLKVIKHNDERVNTRKTIDILHAKALKLKRQEAVIANLKQEAVVVESKEQKAVAELEAPSHNQPEIKKAEFEKKDLTEAALAENTKDLLRDTKGELSRIMDQWPRKLLLIDTKRREWDAKFSALTKDLGDRFPEIKAKYPMQRTDEDVAHVESILATMSPVHELIEDMLLQGLKDLCDENGNIKSSILANTGLDKIVEYGDKEKLQLLLESYIGNLATAVPSDPNQKNTVRELVLRYVNRFVKSGDIEGERSVIREKHFPVLHSLAILDKQLEIRRKKYGKDAVYKKGKDVLEKGRILSRELIRKPEHAVDISSFQLRVLDTAEAVNNPTPVAVENLKQAYNQAPIKNSKSWDLFKAAGFAFLGVCALVVGVGVTVISGGADFGGGAAAGVAVAGFFMRKAVKCRQTYCANKNYKQGLFDTSVDRFVEAGEKQIKKNGLSSR